MSSGPEGLTAEERFRQAFERLKANKPKVLGLNTPVSQNNVAKEANCDPFALKKARFPSLIREIQAYIEINAQEQPSKRKEQLRQRSARAALKDRLHDVVVQRDLAQSQLISAQRRVVELAYEVEALKRELEQGSAGRPVTLR